MLDPQSQALLSEPITAVVMDHDGIRFVSPLVDVDASALRGCCAEDPANWNDIALIWPRYKYHPENTEFADGLPFREMSLDQAIIALTDVDSWYAIDLVGRRLFTGGQLPRLHVRGTPAAEDAEVTVLPPWWELHQHVDALALRSERTVPATIPNPHRDVLWGTAMTRFFAEQMILAIRDGKQWIGKTWEGMPCGHYDLTVAVHRDWLMTPRQELGGGIPRDALHGGKDWIANLADGQCFRVYQGEDPVPLSTDLSTYANASMGRHEVILYFEACRATIDAGWLWLINDKRRIEMPRAEQELAAVLDGFLASWLNSSFEEGRPPAEVIRCDRIRIPLVSHGDEHIVDRDCPICDMMASGMFGPGFAFFDGHQLDVDEEFAFSMCETHCQWEEQQREWEQMDARITADMTRQEEEKESGDDELASVWQNTLISEDDVPGDSRGHIRLAFLLADMVGSLRAEGAEQADIDALNHAFRDYRSAVVFQEVADAAEAFKQTLERISSKHDYLGSRSADLQSRIDDQQRALSPSGFDNDVPF